MKGHSRIKTNRDPNRNTVTGSRPENGLWGELGGGIGGLSFEQTPVAGWPKFTLLREMFQSPMRACFLRAKGPAE